MNREEAIKHQHCPQWLKDATWEGEVDLESGQVIWHGGVWYGGEWKGGVWHSGVWNRGVWNRGVWHSGVWHGGEWEDGVWYGGEWKGGVWHSGVWRSGEWHGGVWCDGVWREGEWRGGMRHPTSRWEIYDCEGDSVRIGCKTKTIPEWDEWFEGDEEFETKRGTEEFKQIYAHYRAVREFKLVMEDGQKYKELLGITE